MLARPILPASPPIPKDALADPDVAIAQRTLIPNTVMQQFGLGLDAAMVAALLDRGDTVSEVIRQRRLQAYRAPPRVTATAKLRRYA